MGMEKKDVLLKRITLQPEIFDTDFSYKMEGLLKYYHWIDDIHKCDTGFSELVEKFSPTEQRFWCLIRMRLIMTTIMIEAQKQDEELKELIALDGGIKKELEKFGKEETFYSISDKKFQRLVDRFTKKVSTFLADDSEINSEDKQKLLKELKIQELEFKIANIKAKESLIEKGLICSALATAAVVLVTMQGAACALLSIPVTLLGASYAAVYKIEPITALGNVLRWYQHEQKCGMGALFTSGAYYYGFLKHDSLWGELFMKAGENLVSGVSKRILSLAAATIAPAYFLTQYHEYSKNALIMGTVFGNPEVEVARCSLKT